MHDIVHCQNQLSVLLKFPYSLLYPMTIRHFLWSTVFQSISVQYIFHEKYWILKNIYLKAVLLKRGLSFEVPVFVSNLTLLYVKLLWKSRLLSGVAGLQLLQNPAKLELFVVQQTSILLSKAAFYFNKI